MTKYEKLKKQIEFETKCVIDDINGRNGEEYGKMPYDITLVQFIGDYGYVDMYDRGALFAYLSIKSKIDTIEGK